MEESKWISVKDRLPDITGGIIGVMGWDGYQAIRVDFYNEEGTRFRVQCLKCFNDVTDSITHWMPLPEPPKK